LEEGVGELFLGFPLPGDFAPQNIIHVTEFCTWQFLCRKVRACTPAYAVLWNIGNTEQTFFVSKLIL